MQYTNRYDDIHHTIQIHNYTHPIIIYTEKTIINKYQHPSPNLHYIVINVCHDIINILGLKPQVTTVYSKYLQEIEI